MKPEDQGGFRGSVAPGFIGSAGAKMGTGTRSAALRREPVPISSGSCVVLSRRVSPGCDARKPVGTKALSIRRKPLCRHRVNAFCETEFPGRFRKSRNIDDEKRRLATIVIPQGQVSSREFESGQRITIFGNSVQDVRDAAMECFIARRCNSSKCHPRK